MKIFALPQQIQEELLSVNGKCALSTGYLPKCSFLVQE